MVEPTLKGLRVVNTRAIHQAHELNEFLEAEGATVLSYPTISIEAAGNLLALDEAIRAAVGGMFDWIVFTSSNTVYALAQRIAALAFDPKALGHTRIAAIGTATAKTIETELGISVDVLPEEFVAESLASALPVQQGDKIFLPQSAIARSVLADKLTAARAEVTAVEAYRTVIGRGGVVLSDYLRQRDVDVVTFTSASTVHNFIQRLKREHGSPSMLIDVVIACIGPVTADAAHAHDLAVKVVSTEHTIQGMVAALVDYFKVRV